MTHHAQDPDSAAAIRLRLATGSSTARIELEQRLARIESRDSPLGAFCETFVTRARAAADAIDAQRQATPQEALPALAGVPIAHKDNLLLAGERATAGSRMLAEMRAPFTATSLRRMEAAGAVLLGRTNMDEFGMGSTTESSFHQRTRNPFDNRFVPGGSSGGSAVAVAADFCPIAIGSDTGGSVRQPAALCGVTGLKPTYGRVPRYGLIAYASSLDCVGAMARSAEDLAIWLDAASGQDPTDPTGLASGPTSTHAALAERTDLRGLRIGIPEELNGRSSDGSRVAGSGIDDNVLAMIERAKDQLQQLGAELRPCRLAATRHAVEAYYLIATCEAASNLARYDGAHYGHRPSRAAAGAGQVATPSCEQMVTAARSEGFGDEVQLRILLGTFASSIGYSDQFYQRALQARGAVRRDFDRAFADFDLLLSPTSPTTAPAFDVAQDDPMRRYLWDALTVPASLAGIPALSMPVGLSARGSAKDAADGAAACLPVGLQLMAAHGQEQLLLQTAHIFQGATDHHQLRANLKS